MPIGALRTTFWSGRSICANPLLERHRAMHLAFRTIGRNHMRHEQTYDVMSHLPIAWVEKMQMDRRPNSRREAGAAAVAAAFF